MGLAYITQSVLLMEQNHFQRTSIHVYSKQNEGKVWNRVENSYSYQRQKALLSNINLFY